MRILVLCACTIVLASCRPDAKLRELIEENGLAGDPAAGIDAPSIEDPLAQLGKKLFFSKSLGGDFDAACVTCHHPALGGGDDLAMSIGVHADDPDLLGPGRTHPDGDLTVPRNAPTTFNIAIWQRALFWDSRVESLNGDGAPPIRTPDSAFGVPDDEAGSSLAEAQARFPVTSADEMRGFEFVAGGSNDELRTALEDRLTEDDRWVAEFEAVYGDGEITYGRIAEAIGAYERSQLFVDTPWRAYVEGDRWAIGPMAKRGALLFFRSVEEGGAGCASCHSGDFFTDESFSSISAPQIGRGKGDGATGTSDFGRERETGEPEDRYTFRTPTLLNVAETGPYLHSGAYDNLADVIRHHFDPQGAVMHYDPASVPDAASEDFMANTIEMIDYLQTSERVIDSFNEPVGYKELEIKALVAFLETLTDPCVVDRECLAPWVADPATDDVDGNLLVAFDDNGDPL
jgi:cytochrome c peroxidase